MAEADRRGAGGSGAGEGPRLSVVIPVFNEEACIEGTVRELMGVLAGLPETAEVLAVDDGSADRTPDLLSALQSEFPCLRVLRLDANSGQSAALGAGFRYARGERIVTMDADGQNDPADIPALLGGLGEADVCCGYRRVRRDSAAKRLGSRLANTVRRAVLRDEAVDTGCTLKAFKAWTVRDLPMDLKGMHRFLPALVRMRGARVAQKPVRHRPRAGGRSKYTNLGRLGRTIADLWAVRWMQKRHVGGDVRELERPPGSAVPRGPGSPGP